MAENKKGFVLYADLIHTVKKMPTEKAGELLLTILQYVNDENPTVNDMLVALVFEPIKQQLKRDLRKYESKKLQWSAAGKASANAKKLQRTLTSVDSRSTDSTVIVTDTVKDIVTVKVKDNKENKAKAIYFDFDPLNEMFLEHLKIRTKIKAVNSEIAITGLINKLNSLSLDVTEQIKIIEQSVMNSWKSYFPLKLNNDGKKLSKSEERFNKIANLGRNYGPEDY